MQIRVVQKLVGIDMITFAIKIIFILFMCSNDIFAFDRNYDIERNRYIETLKKQNPRLVRMLEEDEMDYDEIDIKEAGKITSVSFIDGWCERTFEHTHKTKYVYIYDDGMIETKKYISHYKGSHALNYADDYEHIITIHDKKDDLLFSKHYTWENNMLIQAIDDGAVRNIVSGETPCDFTVIEPWGDSISFNLEPKKKISTPIRNQDAFSSFFNGHHIIFYKNDTSRYTALDAIMYQRHSYCKKYHEEQKLIGASNDSAFPYSDTEKEHTLSYKYHAIIILIIILTSIAIVMRKRKKSANEK